MTTRVYKCPLARLTRLFQRSRDTWKRRAAEKQRSIRALRVNVRDLTASRDHWKTLALHQQQQLRQIQWQLQQHANPSTLSSNVLLGGE